MTENPLEVKEDHLSVTFLLYYSKRGMRKVGRDSVQGIKKTSGLTVI